MKYHFDLGAFTYGDYAALVDAAKREDTAALMRIAGRFSSVDVLAIPFADLRVFLECFSQAILTLSRANDPAWSMIKKSLEGNE